MRKEVIYLTREGYEALKKELNELRERFMYEVAPKIKEARELGDLSENSEYDEAKNEQGKIGSRIREIEEILSKAEVIDESKLNSNTITLGNKVIIKDLETQEELELKIVNPQEADIFENKISIESPLARALEGKKVGDVVRVKAPKGIQRYQILGISF
ncbi:MAG: transcription elongation factor GreA [Thermotogaceae bacterium]|nr:transcription elongation factor GreA [Thermotogaceae bacterium]MDN5337734.1 transcription elongation factor GreA [Thermotogaceae bacterium]